MNSTALIVSNDYFRNKVTFLNVILTVMVVILHAKTPERFGLPLDWNNPFIYIITTITRMAVPSFFFISGMLLFKGYTKETLPRKLKSRFWTLVIPYFLWNVIYVVLYLILTRIPQLSGRMNMGLALQTPIECVKAVFLSKFSDLWFVGDLIIFAIVSPLILLISDKKYPSLILLVLAVLYYFIASPEYMSPLHWVPMYIFGALYGANIQKITQSEAFDKKKHLLLIIIGVLFFISFIQALFTGNKNFFELVSPLAVWFLSDALFHKRIATLIKKQWMSYSFFIFCSHHFLENIFQKFFVLAFEPSPFVLNTLYIFTPFVTIGILVLLCNLIKDTMLYKLLCGNR